MKTPPYLYLSPDSHPLSRRVVIVLPEIFGLNNFVRSVADRAAQDLGVIGVGLDHFFAANGQSNTIAYSEHDKGVELMSQVTGEGYLDLLAQSLDFVQEQFPTVEEIIVLGFCFGGKLAYLSGVDKRVTTIVSFYGGASLAPNFYDGRSAVGALAQARRDATDLRVLGLFGETDDLIPLKEREEIRQVLTEAHITCEITTFPAGHAFFNHDRSDRYVQAAAESAWQGTVIDFLHE